MGRREGACRCAGKTGLSPCGPGPQLRLCWRARQWLPFPEENPKKVPGTGDITGVLCHLFRAWSRPFPRPANHNNGRRWLVDCVLGSKGTSVTLKEALGHAP